MDTQGIAGTVQWQGTRRVVAAVEGAVLGDSALAGGIAVVAVVAAAAAAASAWAWASASAFDRGDGKLAGRHIDIDLDGWFVVNTSCASLAPDLAALSTAGGSFDLELRERACRSNRQRVV